MIQTSWPKAAALLGGLLLIFVLCCPPGAQARGKVFPADQLRARCTVTMIHGLKTPGGFPNKLKHLRSRLRAHPFNRFLSFAFLGQINMKLRTGRLSSEKLVGPYHLEGQLLSQVRTSRTKKRLRFTLSLHRRRTRYRAAKRMLKTTLVLDRGGTMFLAGPSYKGGKLVLGLTCK